MPAAQGSLPTGTVTMLFSDMEGSTRLLTRLGADYSQVLHQQRLLMREAIESWHGRELGTEGDSFFVVFESAAGALRACVEAQRSLADHPWPQDVAVGIRMGLHSGEPEPYENGYVGVDVHLAARIAGTAHGGQVVVSDTTRGLVGNNLPDGVWMKRLGAHRLKDIAELQQLHQLVMPGLREDFPALRSLGTRSNLPSPASPLVGREQELGTLSAFLADKHTRLLTLTGPGGAGKTRLAVALAKTTAARYPDGVYFVPLGDVTDAHVAWTSITEVLGISRENATVSAVLEHVAARRMLIVLDNLEQLPDIATTVERLLEEAPGLSLVTTSRRPLHLGGEQEYQVEPLALPDESGPASTTEEAQQASAVALFIQQARLVHPEFGLTPENVDDVVTLCRRLDGLPLALELAAARTKVLSPQALLARLDQSLALSAMDVRRPDRQRTLRAAVAWSYDLLRPDLRSTFRQLAVLAGGADVDAVVAVTGLDDPVDALAELVDASLLRVTDGAPSGIRVGMLETIRRFALEELEREGEDEETFRAFVVHYLALAERLGADLRGPNALQAREQIERELGNLRQVLTWTLGPPGERGEIPDDRGGLGVRMCHALGWFWYTSGYVAEGRQWTERATAAASSEQGEDLANVLHGLGVLMLQQGHALTGRDILAKCLRIARRLGEPGRIALELNSLGVAYRNLGDVNTAIRLVEESLQLGRTAGDQLRLTTALSNLAMFHLDQGDVARALERLAEAEEIDLVRGDLWAVAADRTNQAAALIEGGRTDDAHVRLMALTPDVAELGDTDISITVIELFALCHAQNGDASGAARLAGAAEALRDQAGLPLADPDKVFLDRHLAPIREATPITWQTEHDAGRAMTLDRALSYARQGD